MCKTPIKHVARYGTGANNRCASGLKDMVSYKENLGAVESLEGFSIAVRCVDGQTTVGKIVCHNAKRFAISQILKNPRKAYLCD